MNILRTVSAVLLAIPLIVFGGNYFLHLFPLPPGDGAVGDQLLQAMRDGGLMAPIAFSHVVAAHCWRYRERASSERCYNCQ